MATNEYDIAQGNIKRRRGLVDALTEQSLTPTKGQMVGQVYVGPGLLDALSKPLMALAGNYAGGKLDTEELQNSQARQSALVDALSSMQPGTPEFTTQGLGSQFPELQAAGMKNLEAQLSPKNIESYGAPVMTAGGKLVQTSNRGNIKETGLQGYIKPENKLQITQGENGLGLSSIDVNSGTATPIPGVTPYVRPPAQTNINNNMPKQESQFGKTMGELDAKRYDAANADIKGAGAMTDLIGRLDAMKDQPMLWGPASPIATKIATVASILPGIKMPEGVSNTEQLGSIVEGYLKDMIAAGGRGFTDEDAKRVGKAIGGSGASREGFIKTLQSLKQSNTQLIDRATKIQGIIRQRYPEAFPTQGGSAPQPGQSSGGIKFLGFE